MASESTFNLEDLDTFFAVKKEKARPAAPKPRVMTTRSSKSTKKRKGVDTVDLDEPSDLSIPDLLKKVSAKYASEKEQVEKQIEDLEDQRKIFTAKASHYEKELAKAKKQIKDMEATHKLQFKEHIDGAKKSAAIAVLRAKIQLVNQAKAEGVDSLAKNMKEWGRILATLAGDKAEASVEVNKAGEVGETSKAGDVEVTGAEAGVVEQEVMMGDDDNDAKVKTLQLDIKSVRGLHQVLISDLGLRHEVSSLLLLYLQNSKIFALPQGSSTVLISGQNFATGHKVSAGLDQVLISGQNLG
ncbi:hypothetical protein E3N88_13846 [Mikania micrantha]|uniref:Uncharacterized protein n=1 Tax=Mikania micrantha TaxID=192012 RepID=A0A5N6P2D4_9ASTR|nr:hypothetical protein E3N88_13846 [Mikania micrantha]